MSDIRVRRTHHFDHADARKAAERVASELKERFGLTGAWKGDALHFKGSGIDGVLKLEEKADFAGKAKVALVGLPQGVTAEEREITQDDTEVKFTVKATPTDNTPV